MSQVVVVVLAGTVTRPQVPALCAGLRQRLESGGVGVVVCDVGAPGRPDATTIDAVARLQLIARRSGARVVLHPADQDLLALMALAGLSEVFPAGSVPAVNRLELRWQAEHGEQPRVEEVRDADDPAL